MKMLPKSGPSERKSASVWMRWLYVLRWMESMMCTDYDQSVRPLMSVKSNGCVKERGGWDDQREI